MKKLFLSSLFISFASINAFSQGLWQANGSGTVFTLRQVGINTNSPTHFLDVAGSTHAFNSYIDSLSQAMNMKAQSAEFAVLLITGIATVDALMVNSNATINGQLSSSSLSVTGNSTLGGTTTMNNSTINGQLTTNNITSSSGTIDFGNNNLTTTGNVSSGNISSLTSDVSNLQSAISNLQPTQWTSNPDSSISFPGNVFVKTLNATEGISIGSFRFTNGGTLPVPVIRDTIRSPYEIVVKSEAEKLMLAANQVEAQQQLGVGKTPGTGVALDVNGNISASGDISSNTVSANSIQTLQLTISDKMESDTMHARKQITVNNSLLLSRETANNYAEVSTIDANVGLVLQRDSAGSGVGIGITPSAGEKLSVQGNVGVSGNLRLSNLSGTGDRVLFVDQNGNLKLQPPSPSCLGLDAFWKTDGNDVQPACDPFIGTKTPKDLVFKTNASDITELNGGERMRIMANGDVRFITGGGNVVIKPGATTDPNDPNFGAIEAKVGIGTENPVRSLHIHTEHNIGTPDPPQCPTCPINMVGSHNGMRLEDFDNGGFGFKSIWDIAPISILHGLIFSKADPNNEHMFNPNLVLLDNGNVGIGTTAPVAKLDVAGGALFSGNVGIGTTIPNAKLEVYDNVDGFAGIRINNASNSLSGNVQVGIDLFNITNFHGRIYGDRNSNNFIFRNCQTVSGDIIFQTNNGNNVVPDALTIKHNGNVGIGIINPEAKLHLPSDAHFRLGPWDIWQNGGGNSPAYFHIDRWSGTNFETLLAIDYTGKLFAHAVKVKTGSFPDFVFDRSYEKMNWLEKEAFYTKEGHLPYVASGKTVEADGLDLGEMMKGMMQNIEEDRLDITELYKLVTKQQEQIYKLQKENEQLKQKK